MSFPIRRRNVLTGLGAAALLASPLVRAQPLFSKPITLLMGVPPGGSLDTQARALAESVSKQLQQTVVVVSRPGVGSTLAPTSMSQSAPDGHTLAIMPTALFRLPHLQKVNFDPLKDFTYIINVTDQPFALLVRADAPWKNMQDFLAHARNNPGKVNYGTMGAGTTMHISMESMARQAGVKLNLIPFKGVSDTYTALLGGHIDSLANTGFVPSIEAGKARLLAVLNDRRLKRWPDVPTLRDLGYKAAAKGGWGIGGPKGMDPKVVQALHDAFKVAMADPAFLRSVEQEEQVLIPMEPPAYTAWAAQEYERERREIAELGIKLE